MFVVGSLFMEKLEDWFGVSFFVDWFALQKLRLQRFVLHLEGSFRAKCCLVGALFLG